MDFEKNRQIDCAEQLSTDLPKETRQRRPQQRTIATRQKILAAALEVFAEKGFDAATTYAISRLAKVDQPLVLYHFKSKHMLWQEVAKYIFAEFRAAQREYKAKDPGITAGDEVRADYRIIFDFTVSYPGLHHFMARESMSDGARLRWLVDEFLRSSLVGRTLKITTAQAEGTIPSGDPRLMHYILVSAITGLSALAREIEMSTGLETRDRNLIEAYWNIIESTLLKS